MASPRKKTAQTNPGKSGTGVKKPARMAAALREGSKRPLLDCAPACSTSGNLQYCALPAETDPNVAIDIFVETNKSSLTIKRFDIVVAIAQGSHGEDLRMRLTELSQPKR